MHYLGLFLFKGLLLLILLLCVLFLLIRLVHRPWTEHVALLKKHQQWIIVIAIVALALFFLLGQAMNKAPSMDFFMQTQGPGETPQLPLSSAFKFLWNVDTFRQVDVAADPNAVPARTLTYFLETEEVIDEIVPGVYVNSWTFNGQIPGPMLRARVGDTVTITIRNKETSLHTHNIDLHAVNGPGGGASVTNVAPGEEKTFSFKALHPGLYIYHCAAMGLPGVHSAHGQYGLILIEPEEGMPPVDKEFYVVQGEVYATGAIGDKGLRPFDTQDYLDGIPTYVVFNGRLQALNGEMHAKVGDKVRIYVGNGGVNLASNFHVIGEIFDTVYPEGGWPVQHNIQTTIVPAGGAAIVEFTLDEPGRYMLVDHALARVDKGAWGVLEVTGDWNETIYSPRPVAAGTGMQH
jgi:nitrite reductase (NO-forming)